MKWTVLGALARAASLLHRGPERTALAELGRELAQLDATTPPATSSR